MLIIYNLFPPDLTFLRPGTVGRGRGGEKDRGVQRPAKRGEDETRLGA